MKRSHLIMLLSFIALLAFLSACSGGGGSAPGELVSPATAYKGATQQATVSQGNAEDLVLGGFGGDLIGSSIGATSFTGKSVVSKDANERPVHQIAQVIKQVICRMEIPHKAAQLREAEPTSRLPKVLQRVKDFQVQGDSGGFASYSLDINDATGSFFGAIDFHAYSSQEIVLAGSADVVGTFDTNRQEFTRLTLSFKALAMNGATSSYTLVGSLSWGFNYTASTETLTIDMALVDNVDGLTYWFKDYELATTYGNGFLTQTISGRYYDYRHGYVDFTTSTPLFIYDGNAWPSQGGLMFSGQQGTSVSVTFRTDSMLIEADTDGDGAINWQKERPTNKDMISFTGTVSYVELEGGFFVIAGDDGQIYDPIDLPADFAVHGRRVSVKARIRHDLVSFHMYEVIIEISDISNL